MSGCSPAANPSAADSPTAAADTPAATSASGYHEVEKITVGGEGKWDYITHDPDNNRLFVSHGTKVDVVDLGSSRVVGEIPNTPGVHGVLLAPGSNKGFISCGGAGVVKVFNTKTLAVTKEIKTGENPDAMSYDPASGRVIVSNGDSESLSVIDPAEEKVLATIPVNGKPEQHAADGKGEVWVNIEEKGSMVALDTKELKVKREIKLAGCEEPASLAMDTKNRRLFAGCRNKVLAVVDPDAGRVITTLPVGERVDTTIYDPETRLIFSSNGDGTVTLVRQESADRYGIVENLKTPRGAKTMALDLKTKRIFLPTAENLPPTATGPPMANEPPFPLKNLVVAVLGK
jgi:YVTN family beta-propeller protein